MSLLREETFEPWSFKWSIQLCAW